jgi:hypothetical protein
MAASNARKRTLRDIWPHLVVSACALLLPPLGMAAGVVYLGSSHPQETAVSGSAEQAAPVAASTEPVRPADPGPALARTSPSPTAPEPQLAAAPAPQPAPATAAASTKDVATKDAAAKEAAPSPAAVAKIGETSEHAARAEAAAPTETADAPAAPAANAQQSGQKSRHDSRGGRIRQARIPSITDIFGVHRYR